MMSCIAYSDKRADRHITIAVAKMIAAESLYQTTITMALHFIGPKALKGIGNTPTKTEFK